MSKTIGFRRNIYLSWLDAAAAFCVETNDGDAIRARLDPIVEQQVASKENRQVAINIVLNIWVKNGERHSTLRNEAVALFAEAETPADRLWLHYGLTSLYYGFFRMTAVALGQLSRYKDDISTAEIKKRIFAEMGQLGGADKATERVIFSLRNWGMLEDGQRRSTYTPLRQHFKTAARPIERWLLATALAAHPAEELPFADLVRLPELFPFQFTVEVDDLRRSPYFEVHRQGVGWDMVRLAPGHLVTVPVAERALG